MKKQPEKHDGFAEKRAYKVDEAARIYGLSRSSLYILMRSGQLRSVFVAGRRLLPRDALEALLDGGSR